MLNSFRCVERGCTNQWKVHRVLLVINLDAGNIYYYLDSLGDEPSKYESCKTKFNNALQIYHALSQTKASKSKLKITWKTIKCPRQTNGIDCGYFVMRFMKELVMRYPNKIPENYFEEHKCRTYSKDKLHEVKEEWADYMITDILPKTKFLVTS
ncbi:hypothetical protein P8452_74058 [Trifolium repens]|nr:hypothetical protein P8452_74058 [Trifolium repens]